MFSNLRRWSCNLSWGMRFRTCENFGESTDLSLVLSPKFSQIQKPHRHYFDCDSAFAESATNLVQIYIKKFLLLLAFAKSRIPSYLTNFNQPKKVNLQNLARSAQKLLLLFAFAKSRILSYLTNFNQPKKVNLQNLTRKAPNPRISHEVRKSFCYFLLLPKVESLLPYQPQLTKKRNFVDSAKQNLIQNNCAKHPKLARFVVQKIGIKGAEVPPADFLLETEKRGTPPKSEKAAAFWRVGGAGRGVQPFLRKESSEFEDN